MAVVFKTFEVIEIDGIPAGNIVDVVSNHAPRRTEVLAAFVVFVDRLKLELAAERDKAIADSATMTTERDTARSEKASLQTELDAANATIETLQAERQGANDAIAELTADLQTAASQLEATTNQLAAANAEIETLTARIDELENPSNPFPDADWKNFRFAILADPAIDRVATENATAWPLMVLYLSQLDTMPSRGLDIAQLWNFLEAHTAVDTEEIARINATAERFNIPLRINEEGQFAV
jgi:seryl-tRNA synthetase